MEANETGSGNFQYDVTVSQNCDRILQNSQVVTSIILTKGKDYVCHYSGKLYLF